tara:strand:+ start:2539 stop:2943 length:405 start_codon:yes stop_codon:yes gene_type:complete
MARKRHFFFFPLYIFLFGFNSFDLYANAGTTSGADIYCVMRLGGNNHESSWQAAYNYIKKQKSGFFKTSPQQSASLIVEEVVAAPEKYQDCVPFLGELYIQNNKQIENIPKINKNEEKSDSSSSKGIYTDRYSY